MPRIAITINDREHVIDTDDLTIGLFERIERMQESKQVRDLIPVLAGLLGVDDDTVRQMTIRQWREISQAIQEATRLDPT